MSAEILNHCFIVHVDSVEENAYGDSIQSQISSLFSDAGIITREEVVLLVFKLTSGIFYTSGMLIFLKMESHRKGDSNRRYFQN